MKWAPCSVSSKLHWTWKQESNLQGSQIHGSTNTVTMLLFQRICEKNIIKIKAAMLAGLWNGLTEAIKHLAAMEPHAETPAVWGIWSDSEMNSFMYSYSVKVCGRMDKPSWDTGRLPDLDWVYAQTCMNRGRRKFLSPLELIFQKLRGKAMSSWLWWWTRAMCHKSLLFHLELEGGTDSWKKLLGFKSGPYWICGFQTSSL